MDYAAELVTLAMRRAALASWTATTSAVSSPAIAGTAGNFGLQKPTVRSKRAPGPGACASRVRGGRGIRHRGYGVSIWDLAPIS